jgi:hypothetical protein
MRSILIIFTFSCLIISCTTTKNLSNKQNNQKNISISTENDGSSYQKAIIINERGESKGVGAEYAWLRQNYPGYTSKGQSLTFDKKKPYDIITIVTAEGLEKEIYFDISKFYGKY